MRKTLLPYFFLLVSFFYVFKANTQPNSISDIERHFKNPPASARPWVFWYWMHGAVSREGIRADLEAMKQVGVGGAYLMPIKDTTSAITFQPTARQLTPEWWTMVKFSMQEAKRLGLQLAMHVSDGFALAGGPWITPELSMQKLVWTRNYVSSEQKFNGKLEQPETNGQYYKDIAVFAYPVGKFNLNDSIQPEVMTSNGTQANFLSNRDGKESFRSDTSCWIQYKYPKSFVCSSIQVHVGGNNYQAQRLIVQASDDGKSFRTITRLEPPRHGWQDTDEDITHSIPPTAAKYFRFLYDKEGAEPGSEDLDAAKWKPSFKVNGIYLSSQPVINQYESKNGSVWRVSRNTTEQQVPAGSAIPLNSIINLTGKMDRDGTIDWSPLPGDWVIVRIGHTSTGHTNATGGAGKGLECDKFNPAAVKLQFDNWFGQAFNKTDVALAKEVLKVFHVDSWECGSQNWSITFRNEFQKRRGYDLMPYLLAMTGVPVQDAATSEKFLHDVRQTIAELVNDVFYKTLNKLAHEKGCRFSAESVAPTMVSDGLLHYKNTDLPMGEFWLNSPTHDKPNDMLDAISGAHIYGKNIVQAEAFTSVRMNWAEHPGNLKVLGDRNFALGINKLVLHVFTHNPWINKKPGMTLDGVGLYFQRDQTWYKQSKAWIEYLARCQALLQMGKPVVDIAVFTGEEVPRRAILPDRLVSTLPGIFGKEKIEAEGKRLLNIGQPLRQIPDGVNHSANMADPEDWIDPLNGYAYDSFNPDALMMMTVKNGRVVLPGGASYAILVIPDKHPMQPNSGLMSVATARKLVQLAKEGATIIMSKAYRQSIGLYQKDADLKSLMSELFKQGNKKGKVVLAPYGDSSFIKLGLKKDAEFLNNNHSIAWAHRKKDDTDIYFISNQKDSAQWVELALRISGKIPQVWDPVDMAISESYGWHSEKGKTIVRAWLQPNQSVFIVFREKTTLVQYQRGIRTAGRRGEMNLSNLWTVRFDKAYGGPDQPIPVDKLKSWSDYTDPAIKYYSGTAVYSKTFNNERENWKTVILELDSVYNIATVKINGITCGTLWTAPFSLDISGVIKSGENKIEIEVTNTWHNRLIGDNLLPPENKITWTTAPFRLRGKPLLPAGLMGDIKLIIR
jgi:hypothetical protein